jgi:malate synthase
VDIPAYRPFLPDPLLAALDAAAEGVPGVPGLRVAPGLQAAFPRLESPEVLGLVVEVYRAAQDQLRAVLDQRAIDRAFFDAGTRACAARNAGKQITDPDWATVIGAKDAQGRVVVGPTGHTIDPVHVEIPPVLQGDQVTLFGPPDSARLAINAMNALHRRRADEPAILTELVESSGQVPRWGADSEDSKTPRMVDLLQASENLAGCFDGTLTFTDPRTGRAYRLADSGRSLPIKRVAGLALPDGHHLLDGSPLPLHLVELVQHVWLHRDRPEAQVLYLPKLENEEEAAYIAALLATTEAAVRARHPAYAATVRIMVVFENPRAIFRIREMAAALHPWFLGGSLGWHDYLASTARLFRHDPGYRIPVKADPDIVIRHIRESHHILVRELGPTGALKLGGMYGVLPAENDAASYAVSMVGFVRDVVTQLKRGLDGFWIAHPDFVRIAVALVEAWRRRERDPADGSLDALVRALVPDPDELGPLLAFVHGPDIAGLSASDPRYLRAVLAAELGASHVIANDDPEEVRYNVFQALQYLADWLCGNGCVALPATMRTARGERVFVRIMDDLATTERSRWELWAEVAHGRVAVDTFDRILAEELDFIRSGAVTPTKRPQVRWEGEAARWYPIAGRLLRQLVVSPEPPEFVTELLLPFTFDLVRDAPDPWARVNELCPGRFDGAGSTAGGPTNGP